MAGAWNFIHGHSGRVEDTALVTDLVYKGWGLSFYLQAGQSTWVHFAVPSQALFRWRVDCLHVQFQLNEEARVDGIQLWDGPVPFWLQETAFSQGLTDTQVWLEEEHLLERGLGVSLKISASTAGDGLFVFHSIGANFRQ